LGREKEEKDLFGIDAQPASHQLTPWPSCCNQCRIGSTSQRLILKNQSLCEKLWDKAGRLEFPHPAFFESMTIQFDNGTTTVKLIPGHKQEMWPHTRNQCSQFHT
jgi:hypothetical protein